MRPLVALVVRVQRREHFNYQIVKICAIQWVPVTEATDIKILLIGWIAISFVLQDLFENDG